MREARVVFETLLSSGTICAHGGRQYGNAGWERRGAHGGTEQVLTTSLIRPLSQ